MNGLVITYPLGGLLIIALAIGLGVVLTRAWRLGWRLWWIGAATFVLSQVGHIPFNLFASALLNRSGLVYWTPLAQAVFNAVFLGLSAGVFEEVSRYLVLRFWAKDARSWRRGVLFGAGHGGMEAMLVGALALIQYGIMLAVRSMDLAALVPPGQLQLAQQQVAAYWSVAWYDSLLGVAERAFALPCQIAMALLVLQAFTRRQIGWLFLAIGYHALLDASAVFLMSQGLSFYLIEAVVGAFALLSLWIIFLLRQPEPPEPEPAPFPPAETVIPVIAPPEESPENLENTRFQ